MLGAFSFDMCRGMLYNKNDFRCLRGGAPCGKITAKKKETAMREEKASALPLLLDVRRMDENNRAYAYRMLRKNIMTLQLQPGCQLSEAELCEQLAMSRTPVHEALMMLKSEWLVDVLPQRGSIVSKISVPYLNEGFAMRRILEPASAARAGRKADKGTAERISGTAEPAERRPLSGSGCSR